MTSDDATRRAGAILTIDLAAIAANWRGLRDAGRAAGRQIDCAAVLKADAYGTGATIVGPRLAAEGCRQFFVAHIDEGIALRAVMPDHPICVLNGLLAGTEGDLVEHGLTPALNHLGQLNAWRAAAQRFNRPLDAVIHIDTGMHRLGFGPEDTQVLINERGRLRGLRLALLMSHLVVSEEPNNPINGEQLSRFRAFVKAMPGAPTSLATSSRRSRRVGWSAHWRSSSTRTTGPEADASLSRPTAARHKSRRSSSGSELRGGGRPPRRWRSAGTTASNSPPWRSTWATRTCSSTWRA